MIKEKQMLPWMPEVFAFETEKLEDLAKCKENDEKIQNTVIKNITAEGEDFTSLCFSQVRFENCCFMDCTFEKTEFTDVYLKSCNISNCNFNDSYWKRAVLKSSKGVGSKFTGSSFYYITMEECVMNYANFDSSKFEYARIRQSAMESAFFSQCKCKEIAWEQVELSHTSFFKTPLKGMDFSTSVISEIFLSDECWELKGLSVDLYQAAELARRLGVIIK